jgi:glycine cleavage system aminomethyltransferase T
VRGAGQAYISSGHALIGESVEVEVRGVRYEARISDFPLMKK